jgi:hypothetical protein
LYQTKTHEELYEILMANLAIITQAVPLAKIPGFDPTQHQFKEEVKLEEPAEEPIPFEEPPVMAAPPAPKKPVKLNVAEEGDEMPVTKKPAAAAPTKPTIDDDVFALADSILNG